ncbi:MAG: ABC transporter permease [Candidatus Omnitrophica bacterium]|nr:ABC transporter permease [Candidatus Omnitrophota bacterium]
MPLILWISLRYLLTRRKERFLLLISIISVLGVAIGVMALLVVLAVMTGFDRDLRDKIVGNYAHINIVGFHPIRMETYNKLEEKITSVKGVAAVSPFIQAQVLLKSDQRYMALQFRGIDPEKEKNVTKLKQYIKQGALERLLPKTAIIGKELANYMGLPVGSEMQIYSPTGKEYKLKVVAIFGSGMYDYDLNLLVVHYSTAQEILEMGQHITGIAVRLDDMFAAERIKPKLYQKIGFDYNIKSWIEANASFFAALKLEKMAMFVILALIVLVASFNIASTLVVMVVEKTKDIGILKAMGLSQKEIAKIFTLEGLLIGASGACLGLIGGLGLCGLLKKYQFVKLPQDIYYLDRMPVAVQFWPDVVLIVLAALVITLLATVYPAFKAAGLAPVEALRYE